MLFFWGGGLPFLFCWQTVMKISFFVCLKQITSSGVSLLRTFPHIYQCWIFSSVSWAALKWTPFTPPTARRRLSLRVEARGCQISPVNTHFWKINYRNMLQRLITPESYYTPSKVVSGTTARPSIHPGVESEPRSSSACRSAAGRSQGAQQKERVRMSW